jgi:hypothetical protein
MNRTWFILLLIYFVPAISFSQHKDLDYYLANAVNNSPLLNEYRNNILTAGIDSALIVAANKYQVAGNGNAYVAPIINGFGYDKAITDGQHLSALIAINKQVYNKRNLTLGFADIQLQKDSIDNASRMTEQDLKKTIIGQYITTYADQLQLDFNNQLLGMLQKEEIILKKLTQQNVYKQVDYLSFLVTMQQQDLTRQQLGVQYKNDFAQLNYLAGIFDTSISSLDTPHLEVLKTFYSDSSVFFLKYKLDSLRLINNKALIDLGYRPKIGLFADAGYQSSFDVTPYKNFGTSFGINFTIPIYDGRQRKLQYTKLAIQERTRLKNKEFFQNQYYQQIAQLQQQLNAITNLEEPINRQIRYLETLIAANGKLLESGDIKMTDYVLGVNNYITAKNLLVQNLVSRYQVINQLNYWKK